MLFPNARGTRLSPDGVHYLLARHSRPPPGLPGVERQTRHRACLRHTMALDLLQGGVDAQLSPCGLGTNP